VTERKKEKIAMVRYSWTNLSVFEDAENLSESDMIPPADWRFLIQSTGGYRPAS
jgi:hypothetical protein